MERAKQGKMLEIRDVIKTEGARINYLMGLIRIAESDDKKTSSEEGYIYRMSKILGASHAEIWQAERKLENEQSPSIQFATNQEKMLFLMQALYMCWIDSDYSAAERKAIITIAAELGVSITEIEAIESWVKEGIDWMRAGASLLGLE